MCGNELPSFYKKKPMEECDMLCTGDQMKTCGGSWRNNVWKVCKEQECNFDYPQLFWNVYTTSKQDEENKELK